MMSYMDIKVLHGHPIGYWLESDNHSLLVFAPCEVQRMRAESYAAGVRDGAAQERKRIESIESEAAEK